MVGVVEGDDRVPAGGHPGDLDRVLHRLGAGVEQRRALLVIVPGVSSLSFSATVDVLLVRRDHEAGVGEVGDLGLHAFDHPRRGVADRGHGDARAEVDQLVVVDVEDDPAAGLLDVHRQRGADPAGHGRGLARVHRLRRRAGDRGVQDPLLFDGHVGLLRLSMWGNRPVRWVDRRTTGLSAASRQVAGRIRAATAALIASPIRNGVTPCEIAVLADVCRSWASQVAPQR